MLTKHGEKLPGIFMMLMRQLLGEDDAGVRITCPFLFDANACYLVYFRISISIELLLHGFYCFACILLLILVLKFVH